MITEEQVKLIHVLFGKIENNEKQIFKNFEKKWQDIWDEKQTFAAKDDYTLPKFYGCYPSSDAAENKPFPAPILTFGAGFYIL